MHSADKWIEGFGPDSDARRLALAALEMRLAAVSYWLPAAAYCANHDIENVHKLRVSTRRALAALQLFRDWLPRKQFDRMKKQLKKIRDAAGLARDLDVFAERLRTNSPENAELVVAEVATQRVAAQPVLEHVADRLRRQGRFARRASKLLSGLKRDTTPAGNGAATPLKSWAQHRLADVANDFFDATPADNRNPDDLHQFRIEGKRLRYVIEILAGGLNAEVRKVHYPVIEDLQEHLGTINDHAAAAAQLRDWAGKSDDATRAEQFQAVAQRETLQLEESLESFHGWWTPERIESLQRGLGCDADRAPARGRTVLVS